MYPYMVLEILGLESETGSSSAPIKTTLRDGDVVTEYTAHYQTVTLNIQCLAGEVSENSVDAFAVLSDVVSSLSILSERSRLCVAGAVPITWESVINLTDEIHNEFVSRASVDVMFRMLNLRSRTGETTESVTFETDVDGTIQSTTTEI